MRSLLVGQRLWLTALGRDFPGGGYEKHGIKRMDRLLGNSHLSAERPRWYRWLARRLIGEVQTPVISVDWSPLDARGQWHVLRAAVAVGGRGLPVYERVYSRCNDPKAQRQFLRQLKRILPPKCRPILVSDAGFQVDWYQDVAAMGWFYVGRILGVLSVKLDESSPWIRNARLYLSLIHI